VLSKARPVAAAASAKRATSDDDGIVFNCWVLLLICVIPFSIKVSGYDVDTAPVLIVK
jgi:hypothetical protein